MTSSPRRTPLFRLLAATCATLQLAAGALAQSATPDFPTDLRIRGRVVDSSGAPVEGARVTIGAPSAPHRSALPSSSSSADGRFELRLYFRSHWAPMALTVEAEGACPATVKEVPGRLGITDVGDITVLRPGRIEGRVLDPRGEPVAGAWVFSGEVPDWATDSTFTDASGDFTLMCCHSCFGRIGVVAEGYADTKSDYFRLAEGATAEVNLVLGLETPIEGIVVDGQGRPVPNVRLNAHTWIVETAQRRPVLSDASGRFRVRGARMPVPRVAVDDSHWRESREQHAGPPTSKESATFLRIVVEPRRDSIVEIVARWRDGAPFPISGLRAVLVQERGKPGSGEPHEFDLDLAPASPEVEVVAPHRWRIARRTTDRWSSFTVLGPAASESAPIPAPRLTDAPIPNLEVTVDRGSRVSGVIVRPDGEPARLWRVFLDSDQRSREALSAADGRFAFLGVPPGSWTLRGGTWAIEWTDTESEPASAESRPTSEFTLQASPLLPITVEEGRDVDDLTVLATAPPSIAGTVRRGGVPFPDAQIAIVDSALSWVLGLTRTDAEGRFEVFNSMPLLGQEVQLVVIEGPACTDSLRSFQTELEGRRGDALATAILPRGGTTHVDLQVPDLEPAVVHGSVSLHGPQLSTARVELRHVESKRHVSTWTDVAGRYEIHVRWKGPAELTFTQVGKSESKRVELDLVPGGTIVRDVEL